MTLEAIQQICKSFEEVTEDIKWEEHLCFNVGGKMFLITSPDLAPVTASFKVSAEDFDLLIEREGFKPGTSGFGWMISAGFQPKSGKYYCNRPTNW